MFLIRYGQSEQNILLSKMREKIKWSLSLAKKKSVFGNMFRETNVGNALASRWLCPKDPIPHPRNPPTHTHIIQLYTFAYIRAVASLKKKKRKKNEKRNCLLLREEKEKKSMG